MSSKALSVGARVGSLSVRASSAALLLVACIVVISIPQASAVCYCPMVFNRNPRCRSGSIFSKDSGDWCAESYLLERRPCLDSELKGECEHAKWEIEDYIDGRYSKRDKLLVALREAGNLTLDEQSATDAAVTTAIEDTKIQLGLNLECTRGLFTTTLVNDGVLSWCYSPILHSMCSTAQRQGPKLVSGIIPALRRLAEHDADISQEFIQLYEFQFTRAVDSLDIHCNVTAYTEVTIINGAAGGVRAGHGVLAAGLSGAALALLAMLL
eukprot:jgi/Ulvmu1/8129/UM040_0025.1